VTATGYVVTFWWSVSDDGDQFASTPEIAAILARLYRLTAPEDLHLPSLDPFANAVPRIDANTWLTPQDRSFFTATLARLQEACAGSDEPGPSRRSIWQTLRPVKEGVVMPRTRVHNMNVSLDGYAAGEHVTFDAPIGGAERLFKWFDGRVIHGVDKVDAPVTLDRALTSMWSQGIGAEIMGRRKFGPQVGDWPDDGWRGWWGDEPPFQTPVFVMSHHPHPAIDFPNGTSFRFVDGPPEEVLRLAQEAAGGRDVRIGGGPSTVRQFLQAGLVDFMHLVIVPITLGRGVSLWEGSSGLEDRFTIESVTSPSGLTHQLWNKNDHV
jgi:dihydrofolate reductase